MNVQSGNPSTVGIYVVYVDPSTPVLVQHVIEKTIAHCSRELAFWDGENWCTMHGSRLNRRIYGFVGEIPTLPIPKDSGRAVHV